MEFSSKEAEEAYQLSIRQESTNWFLIKKLKKLFLHVMLLTHKPLPVPMPLPNTILNVINRDSFSLWHEEQSKESHHNDPSTEEEENP